MFRIIALCLLLLAPDTFRPNNDLFQVNEGRPLLDAHNCYPVDGQWPDRIDRALSTGFPVAIEQDVAAYADPQSGAIIPKVTHNKAANASEPTLRERFFEKVRPIVEKALKQHDTKTWPLIVVHFDFKDNDPKLLKATWNLLGEYENWITTAKKTDNDAELAPLEWKPLLVLTEENDNQEQVFYRDLPVSGRLRLFGSAHTNLASFEKLTPQQKAHALASANPSILLKERASNYRRWWNNSWHTVEEGGQPKAGDWTQGDEQRLRALVNRAHQLGYWIRFYTLDGFNPGQSQGWSQSYNFGSLEAVQKRWKAALDAGVDMIAVDQYEEMARFIKEQRVATNR